MAAAVVARSVRLQHQGPGGSGSGGGGDAADVQTDVGVEGDTITLGVLTDLTGVFAALGKDITNANDAVLEGRNKVCDNYTSSSTSRTPATSPSRASSSTAG